jgi:hypothetical protein
MNTRGNTRKCVAGMSFAALATLGLLGPAWGAEMSQPSGQAAPAKAPSSFALPHHATGQIISVNKPAKMFTLKTADGTTLLLTADEATLPQFSILKKGERVKVTYKNSEGQSVATKISPI